MKLVNGNSQPLSNTKNIKKGVKYRSALARRKAGAVSERIVFALHS